MSKPTPSSVTVELDLVGAAGQADVDRLGPRVLGDVVQDLPRAPYVICWVTTGPASTALDAARAAQECRYSVCQARRISLTTSIVGRSIWPSRSDTSSARASRAAWSAGVGQSRRPAPWPRRDRGPPAGAAPSHRVRCRGWTCRPSRACPGPAGPVPRPRPIGGDGLGHLAAGPRSWHCTLRRTTDPITPTPEHQGGQPGDECQPALPARRGRGQDGGRGTQTADHQRNHQQDQHPAGEQQPGGQRRADHGQRRRLARVDD